MINIVSLHFGSGGGHLFGGLTLWQAFKIHCRVPFQFTILSDSVIEVPFKDDSLEVFSILLEPEKMLTNDKDSILYQYLKHLDSDVIIVDNIWFPVSPFISEFKAIKVIYFRFLPPEWFITPPLDDGEVHAFDPSMYDLAFTIDPEFEIPNCISVPPVINVHEQTMKPPDKIRAVLEVPDDKKLALVAHNGYEGEIEANNEAG